MDAARLEAGHRAGSHDWGVNFFTSPAAVNDQVGRPLLSVGRSGGSRHCFAPERGSVRDYATAGFPRPSATTLAVVAGGCYATAQSLRSFLPYCFTISILYVY